MSSQAPADCCLLELLGADLQQRKYARVRSLMCRLSSRSVSAQLQFVLFLPTACGAVSAIDGCLILAGLSPTCFTACLLPAATAACMSTYTHCHVRNTHRLYDGYVQNMYAQQLQIYSAQAHLCACCCGCVLLLELLRCDTLLSQTGACMQQGSFVCAGTGVAVWQC